VLAADDDVLATFWAEKLYAAYVVGDFFFAADAGGYFVSHVCKEQEGVYKGFVTGYRDIVVITTPHYLICVCVFLVSWQDALITHPNV